MTPISRKSGLSKTALRDALTAADIGYPFPRLVESKDNHDGFARPGPDRDCAITRFLALEQQAPAQAALDKVRTRAQSEQITLLCYEDDPSSCHRRVILNILTRT